MGIELFGEDPSQAAHGGQVRRSQLEMTCDILYALVDGPTKPTRVLQKANMSWKALTAHLDYLQRRKLVTATEQGERVEYSLTQEGRSILRLYEGLKLSLTGEGKVYPSREPFPLIVRGSQNSREPQPSSW